MGQFTILGVDVDSMKPNPSSAPIRIVHVVPVETQAKRAKVDPWIFLSAVNDWACDGFKKSFVHWYEIDEADGKRIGLEFDTWTLGDIAIGYAIKVRSWGKSRRRFNDSGEDGIRSIKFLFVPVMELIGVT